MPAFWQLVLSNTVLASALALGAWWLGRDSRRAAVAHLVWLVVLLKLIAPPVVVCGPAAPGWPRSATPVSVIGRPSAVGPRPAGSETAPPPSRPGPSAGRSLTRSVGSAPSAIEAAGQAVAGWAGLGAAWLVLSGVTGVVICGRLVLFGRQVRQWPLATGPIAALVPDLAAQLGLPRVPTVKLAAWVVPPLVWSGGGRPVVVLPAALVASLPRDEVATILLHELAHIRRRDHWVRWLELIALVALPWHPLVWLAIARLRDLEEVCCDALVRQASPDRPRAYALALVATLEFLSGRRVPAVPLRTAIRSAHPLAQRIAMLKQAPPRRPTLLGWSLLASLLAGPLALTVAQVPAPAPAPASAPNPVAAPAPPGAPTASPTVVRGQVVNKSGQPIADARVRLAIPAADLRFARLAHDEPSAEPPPAFQETRTDATGHYEFRLAHPTTRAMASFDVLKPGYRRLVGTLMAGGDDREVEVEPGRTTTVPLTLTEPCRYLRGVVVDEAGQPVAGVQIGQYFDFTASGGTGGAELTATRADGSFELFNVDPEAGHWRGVPGTSYAVFDHPRFVSGRIDDLHAIAEADREKIRVVLTAGRTVAGTVRDRAGKPVAGALVAAEYSEGEHGHEKRKATETDQAGRFALYGLAAGPADLKVHAFAIDQKAKLPLPGASTPDLAIQLAPLGLPADLATYDVLGMKLADVTPAVRAAYDLYHPQGAVILDPGANPERLGIGTLSEGDVFWFAGDDEATGTVTSVRDFVRHLLAESGKAQPDPLGVRVVYTFDTPAFSGTNTQYLKLTTEDRQALQNLADRLAK